MFVNDISEVARGRLVLIAADAELIEAAKFLTSGTDIVVVRDGDGIVQGVVTKTDVVKQMSVCRGAACHCPVSTVMTPNPMTCHGSDLLQDVSLKMKTRHLKNIVLVDESNRPIGLLTARSILRVLLGDAQHEEEQLVDYISGAGYR
ncbi:CBS domain-containing protein [Salinarimonas ramus]|uniref:CBS domain-containing protein n=1 Tax=Salinarimonas ramus TaxID=690164 RepID=A0A917QJ66_9HYPH|nr:CBS domain-containing protein [Salinarimonas ramus]GGK51586.1 hypothetical protein GCM10011322_43270 [Salinarimonas ramus]